MRTATGLSLIAVGAILAFAFTASPPGFNIHVAGVVIMLTGLAGLVIRRKGYAWLRKRMVIAPRARVRRGRRGTVVEETRYLPYVMDDAGTSTTVDLRGSGGEREDAREEIVEERYGK